MSEREKLVEAIMRETASWMMGCDPSILAPDCCEPCKCKNIAESALTAISSQGYAVVPKKGGGMFARSYERTIAYADIARPVPANPEKT